MTEQPQRWAAVAHALNARLDHLLWTQAELHRRSKISKPTLKSVMDGTFRNEGNPRDHTLAIIGRAVGFPPSDWVRLAMDGEEIPTTTPPGEQRSDPASMLDAVYMLSEVGGQLAVQLDRQGQMLDRLAELISELERRSDPPAAPAQPRPGPKSRSKPRR